MSISTMEERYRRTPVVAGSDAIHRGRRPCGRTRWPLVLAACGALLGGCGTLPMQPSSGHIERADAAPAAGGIPEPVLQAPGLADLTKAPADTADPALNELYSVVVTDMPVRDVLFALARDSHINIDIHPGLRGKVTLNAIDQPITRILDRIANQVDLRYHWDKGTLVVARDEPYFHTYPIDYLNLTRTQSGTVSVATQIATTGSTGEGGGGGGGGNGSSSTLSSDTNNDFWVRLIDNLHRLLVGSQNRRSGVAGLVGDGAEAQAGDDAASNTDILANRLAGLITVRATARQHRQIQAYLDQLMTSSRRQVLIEATIVEIELSNDYQSGVDWSILGNRGFGFEQSLIGNNLQTAPFSVLTYTNTTSSLGNINAAVRAMETFGDVKVLSSPKLMALNNQPAVLKVVDDRVYFTFEVDPAVISNGTVTPATVETEVHTVPVGLVMSVTPQISGANEVTLIVRPSISRIINFVQDPNPELRANSATGQDAIVSNIPEVQVREIESVLTVESGQTAVLGGLMQDASDNRDRDLPWAGRLPVIGNFFRFRDQSRRKTELVIFLRPVVTSPADLRSDDLRGYRDYLPALDTRPESGWSRPGEPGPLLPRDNGGQGRELVVPSGAQQRR